jgi:hypothetical protein
VVIHIAKMEKMISKKVKKPGEKQALVIIALHL